VLSPRPKFLENNTAKLGIQRKSISLHYTLKPLMGTAGFSLPVTRFPLSVLLQNNPSFLCSADADSIPPGACLYKPPPLQTHLSFKISTPPSTARVRFATAGQVSPDAPALPKVPAGACDAILLPCCGDWTRLLLTDRSKA